MTITASDIKLLASERMTDTTDGGGRRTGNVIADGVAGNVFPKVSRLDSVYGRVNMRKLYGAVQTATLDTYAGAHAVVMDAADNDRIHVNLFSTGSDFDNRTAARDRIESYVIAGPESRMVLYGRQLVGQMAISAYQNPTEQLPEVGEVYCLSTETAGVVVQQQYVRITDVAHDVRTFEDGQGEYQRRVVTMQIGSPLRYEFTGPDTAQRFTTSARPSLLRRTSVADAARYFGIQPVQAAALAGALTIKVASVYSPIVPTTQRETPLSNGEIAGAETLLAAGTVATTRIYPQVEVTTATHTIALAGAAKPGSVSFSVTAVGIQNGTWTFADDGAGALVYQSGGDGSHPSAVIDYLSGTITWPRKATSYSAWAFTASHIAAAPVGQVAHTREIEVSLATRGTVYVQTLSPLSSPGTLVVDFRALGKWYRLRDDGTGALAGDDAAFGTGTVDYVTGAVVVTLGALPDVGSSVLMGWASPAHYAVKAGPTSDAGATVKQRIMLTSLPVKPSTVVVEYTSGVTVNTGTETADGVISGGSVTGTINHATGELLLEYTNKLPNTASDVTVSYTQEVPTGSPTSISGSVTVTDPTDILLPTEGSAIAPKGLRIQIPVIFDGYGSGMGSIDCADDGSGSIITLYQQVLIAGRNLVIASGQVMGTVNYATGAVSITTTSIGATMQFWTGNLWIATSLADI